MIRLRKGRDAHGLIHYDSRIKWSYIYPVCRTPYLDLDEAVRTSIVTCVECIGSLREFEEHWGEDAL